MSARNSSSSVLRLLLGPGLFLALTALLFVGGAAVDVRGQAPAGQPQAAPAPQAPGTPAGRAGGAAQPGQPGARAGGGGGRGNPFAGQTPINVLVVSGGCCHDYPGQNRLLYDLLSKAAPIHWTFSLGMTNIPDGRLPLYNDPAWASKFDLVVHNECWANGDLPANLMRNITNPQNVAGIPAMYFHCSLHSYRSSALDQWREAIGITSRRHTRAHEIPVKWQEDPIVAGLAPFTTPTDELYVVEKQWPGVKAIATAVNAVDQGFAGPNENYAVAWTQELSSGARVFGTSLGHANPTWDAPQFQEMVTRAFRWVMRKDPLVGWPTTPAPAPGAPAQAPQGGRGAAPGGGRAGGAQ